MLDTDLQLFNSEEKSDTGTNGGRMGSGASFKVTSGVSQNVWDHVAKADRDAGITQYRKVHVANRNSSNEAALNVGLIYDGDTLGADSTEFWPGTHKDTQADVVSSPPSRTYVSGTLKTITAAVDTSLTIVFKTAAQAAQVANGDKVYISEKEDPDSVSGNAVERTINAAPSVSDNEVTISLSAAVGFVFPADDTKICLIYEPGDDLEPTAEEVSNSIAGDGAYDVDEIELDNIGTVEQQVTLDFTGTASFTATSNVSGITLAAGSTGSEYAPSNPVETRPYFTLPISFWTDLDFANGDQIVLQFNPSAIPQWQKRIVPSSCPSLANNRIRPVIMAESTT